MKMDEIWHWTMSSHNEYLSLSAPITLEDEFEVFFSPIDLLHISADKIFAIPPHALSEDRDTFKELIAWSPSTMWVLLPHGSGGSAPFEAALSPFI
jgi:hypothetical protein